MVAEVIYSATIKPKLVDAFQNVLLDLIKVAHQKSFKLDPRLVDAIKAGFLQALVGHTSVCQDCAFMQELGKEVTMLFAAINPRSSPLNWPENKPFAIHPFLAKTSESMIVVLPHGSDSKHVSSASPCLLWDKKGAYHAFFFYVPYNISE